MGQGPSQPPPLGLMRSQGCAGEAVRGRTSPEVLTSSSQSASLTSTRIPGRLWERGCKEQGAKGRRRRQQGGREAEAPGLEDNVVGAFPPKILIIKHPGSEGDTESKGNQARQL